MGVGGWWRLTPWLACGHPPARVPQQLHISPVIQPGPEGAVYHNAIHKYATLHGLRFLIWLMWHSDPNPNSNPQTQALKLVSPPMVPDPSHVHRVHQDPHLHAPQRLEKRAGSHPLHAPSHRCSGSRRSTLHWLCGTNSLPRHPAGQGGGGCRQGREVGRC